MSLTKIYNFPGVILDKILNKSNCLWENVLLTIFIWCGTKLFNYVHLYVADEEGDEEGDEEVIGVTFASRNDYIEKINDIE